MLLMVVGEYNIQMILEGMNYCYHITKFPDEIVYKAKGYDDAVNKLKEFAEEG